jgi:hypothetical protein
MMWKSEKFSNRFAALEKLEGDVDINTVRGKKIEKIQKLQQQTV